MVPSAIGQPDGRQEAVKQFSPLARSLARRIAFRQADEDDLVQEGLFALDRALQSSKPRSLGAFAQTVMRRAMWHYNLQPWVQDTLQTSSLPEHDGGLVGLEVVEVQLEGVPYQVQQEQLLTEQAYYAGLERTWGPDARRIAENLVEPRDDQLVEYLETSIAKTLRQQKAKPCETCGCVHRPRIRLSKSQVRRGLGITYEKWYVTLKHIKEYTTSWLAAHNAALPAGITNIEPEQ